MGIAPRLILTGVLNVVSRPRLVLLLAALLLASAVWLASSRLTISTDQNKLFSPRVSFFADYLEYIEKFPENEAIYVVVEAKDPAHPPPVKRWTAAADAIAARLAPMKEHVRVVSARVPIEKLGEQGLLFESPDKLHEAVSGIRQFIPLMKLWGEKPGLSALIGSTPLERFLAGVATQKPDPQTAAFVEILARSWTATLDRPDGAPVLPDLAQMDAADPSRLGYYYVPDDSDPSNHLLLVRVYPQRNFNTLTAISQTVQVIRSEVRTAAQAFPDFAVGLTGRPALEADEMQTTDRDSHRAEIVALIVVFIGLVVFLRSIWLAIAAEICLGVAIGWTFGWATVSVGHLNLLSIVFLIALIGIGMDYLVQILVRYRQEASLHASPRAIWARVFRHVGPPINTACLGAAGAFLVAWFTDFRGAAELGIIAGGGLLLCLFSGYTVLPAILTIFPGKTVKGALAAGSTADEPRWTRRPPAQAGGWRLLFPAIWALALLIGVLSFAPRTGFNPNLIELQATNLQSVQLIKKLQSFSAVVLSRDLGILREVRDAVKDLPSVAGTESIVQAYDNARWLQANAKLPNVDWVEPAKVKSGDIDNIHNKAASLSRQFAEVVPKSPKEQHVAFQNAANALAEFAAQVTAPDKQIDRIARRLSEWQTGFVKQLQEMLQQFNPGPPKIMELPLELRGHFISEDGTMALYIYPRGNLWNRENLARFVTQIGPAVKSVPGAPRPTGISENVYHTTQSIEHSFYRSAAYALGLIFVLVLIDLRSISQTLLAISVLVLGLPMLVSIMGLIGADWNFANFFGLPILIGAGHEYGVFMVHRYREARADPRRFWRSWDASDKALLLCAYVTCSSFGFFYIMANHRGLKSLGLVMALGTACIYLATLLVVRPLLLWRLRKHHPQQEGEIPVQSVDSKPGNS